MELVERDVVGVTQPGVPQSGGDHPVGAEEPPNELPQPDLLHLPPEAGVHPLGAGLDEDGGGVRVAAHAYRSSSRNGVGVPPIFLLVGA
ncbi:hypothetical protein GCM10010428_27380 [Actinosynnema pretiosum subsp. pretiosum]